MEDETQPATVGALLRHVRQRVVPDLSIRELARRTGINYDYIGAFERDNVRGRNGNTVNVGAERVARMFSGVPLEDGDRELLRALNPEAARILETLPPADQSPQGHGDEAADSLIEMLVSLVGEEHHRKVLEFLWEDMDSEGRLKPRADRIASMIGWVETRMRGRDTGDGSASVHSL